MGKSWNFVLVIPTFLILEYNMQNLFFVTCVSFLACYLTTGGYMCPNLFIFLRKKQFRRIITIQANYTCS